MELTNFSDDLALLEIRLKVAGRLTIQRESTTAGIPTGRKRITIASDRLLKWLVNEAAVSMGVESETLVSRLPTDPTQHWHWLVTRLDDRALSDFAHHSSKLPINPLENPTHD